MPDRPISSAGKKAKVLADSDPSEGSPEYELELIECSKTARALSIKINKFADELKAKLELIKPLSLVKS